MVIVRESAVIGAVFFSLTATSLYQGWLTLITGVIFNVPAFVARLTVNGTAIVLVIPFEAPVTMIVPEPVMAAVDAVSLRLVFAPDADWGSNEAVTPVGNSLPLNATGPLNPPVRAIASVAVPLAP